MPTALRLYLDPAATLDTDQVSAVVESAGGELVADAASATAVVWSGGSVEGLRSALHPGIGWVQLGGVGIEQWLASDLLQHPATFTYAGGYFGEQVAEHALALLLACSRRLMTCARQSSWASGPDVWGTPLSGATICLVGAGDIGTTLAGLLAPLGPRVLAVTRSGREVPGTDAAYRVADLDTALAEADYVVLSLPSTPQTRQLFDADRLARMRRTAWVVNVGRGDAIDSDALAAALDRGDLAGAALDVTDPEPLPDGHPLWTHPRVLITPHVANPPALRDASLLRLIRTNAERFARGDELVSVVDVDRGY